MWNNLFCFPIKNTIEKILFFLLLSFFIYLSLFLIVQIQILTRRFEIHIIYKKKLTNLHCLSVVYYLDPNSGIINCSFFVTDSNCFAFFEKIYHHFQWERNFCFLKEIFYMPSFEKRIYWSIVITIFHFIHYDDNDEWFQWLCKFNIKWCVYFKQLTDGLLLLFVVWPIPITFFFGFW